MAGQQAQIMFYQSLVRNLLVADPCYKASIVGCPSATLKPAMGANHVTRLEHHQIRQV